MSAPPGLPNLTDRVQLPLAAVAAAAVKPDPDGGLPSTLPYNSPAAVKRIPAFAAGATPVQPAWAMPALPVRASLSATGRMPMASR